jgi:hypothetical protein
MTRVKADVSPQRMNHHETAFAPHFRESRHSLSKCQDDHFLRLGRLISGNLYNAPRRQITPQSRYYGVQSLSTYNSSRLVVGRRMLARSGFGPTNDVQYCSRGKRQ